MSSKKNVMGKSAKVSKKFIFIDSFSRHGMNSPLRNLDKMRKRGKQKVVGKKKYACNQMMKGKKETSC